jgi:hypothetical protein
MPDAPPPEEPGRALAPRTTDDWLVDQTGVDTFHTQDGQLAMSFKPDFVARFNFLGPQSQVVQLDPSFKPIAKVITLNKDVHAYKSQGKYQLTKQGLSNLAELAQIEKDGDPKWDYMDGKGLAVTVRARRRNIDGTWRHTAASKTVWFDRAEKKIRREAGSKNENEVEKLIDEFYDHVSSKLETKSWLRCVREMLGIPNAFTERDLQKPFFVIGVALVPDWSNPQISKLLDVQFDRGSRDLFGDAPTADAMPPAAKRELGPGDGSFDADVDEADAWDDDDEPEEAEGSAEEPESFAEPEEGFTPNRGPYEGTHVKDIVQTAEGRQWVAGMVAKMRSENKKAQGLAWLSWSLQVQVTMDTLDQVA